MTKKVATGLFIIISMLVLLAVLPGAVLAQEGDGAMAGEAMMADGTLMVEGTDGQMMEVAMGDKAMAGEAMAGEALADNAMVGDKAMMAGGYAHIENPDIIEPGWVLCIPNAEDAQKLLSETAAMAK